MKVYGIANEIIWDGKHNRELTRFKNGMLETSDAALVRTLKAAGYKVEGDIAEENEGVGNAPAPSVKRKSVRQKKEV